MINDDTFLTFAFFPFFFFGSCSFNSLFGSEIDWNNNMFIEKRTKREVDGTKNCSTSAIDGIL